MFFLVILEDFVHLEDQEEGQIDLRYDVTINLKTHLVEQKKKIRYSTYKKCKTCSGSGA